MIGIICEAGLGSEDEQVLRHLAGRIRPDATAMIRPLGRKPDLIVQCGQVAQALFDSVCERVLVIWDVFPRWGRPDGEAQDIADIQAILTQAGLANHPVSVSGGDPGRTRSVAAGGWLSTVRHALPADSPSDHRAQQKYRAQHQSEEATGKNLWTARTCLYAKDRCAYHHQARARQFRHAGQAQGLQKAGSIIDASLLKCV